MKSVLHQLKHFTGISDEQKKTQHTSLWQAKNDWGPTTSSTINHDPLPAVGEEPPTNGQHTGTYTNRLQFEYYKCRAEQYNTEKIPCILCMHLAECRFFMHLTALMHLQN